MAMVHTSQPGFVLFDASQQRYYSLDAMAAVVWNLVKSPVTFREILEAVAAHFDLEPAAIERHVREILTRLESDGLIETASG
jgi:DNA-directed RNA polymerase delta subunit